MNFNYVEGDDASTVLHHLCGRNSQIQTPYASYNSGLDFLIKITNLHIEESIRTFAVLVSFISGFLILSLFVLFLEAFFEGCQEGNNKYRSILYLLLPFIIPDFIFHSLIINSTNISFVFLLSSLILFIKFLKTNLNVFLYLSTILFAISIPFRWTMLVSLPLYIGFALYFHPIQYYSKDTLLLFSKIIIANLCSVFLAIACIYATGYNLEDIYNTIMSAMGYLENSENSSLSILSTVSAFLTPSLLFLVLLGVIKIYELNKKQAKLSLSIISLVVLSISPFFVVGFFPSYKFLISLVPIILIIVFYGFDYLIRRKFLGIIFLILVVTPWFIGVQLDVKGTFCGPGFELNTNKGDKIVSKESLDNNPDKRININGIYLKLDSGFYLPMLEGPRPLYGYFYVLFADGWKNQINLFTKERQKIYEFLIKNKNTEYIQDRRTAYFQCDLYNKGFLTHTDFLDKKNILFRKYSNKETSINVYVIPDNCSKSEWILNYFKNSKNNVIYRSSYSNDILTLLKNEKKEVKILGPFTVLRKAK